MFSEMLKYSFMQNAFMAAVLSSILCGIIGTFVVTKRMVFISGGISHAAFGGLGLFFFLGLDPMLGAFTIALISAVILGLYSPETINSQDANIGILWSAGMAMGILFITLSTRSYTPNLMSYLFGNILMVHRENIYYLTGLTLTVVIIIFSFFKYFLSIAFDEEFARLQDVPVPFFRILLLVMTGITIVALIQMVGIILVIALLTIPTMISMLFLNDFKRILMVSVLVSVFLTFSGIALSYFLDLPTGPVIIILGAFILLTGNLIKRFYINK